MHELESTFCKRIKHVYQPNGWKMGASLPLTIIDSSTWMHVFRAELGICPFTAFCCMTWEGRRNKTQESESGCLLTISIKSLYVVHNARDLSVKHQKSTVQIVFRAWMYHNRNLRRCLPQRIEKNPGKLFLMSERAVCIRTSRSSVSWGIRDMLAIQSSPLKWNLFFPADSFELGSLANHTDLIAFCR